jgi:maleylpyruvate isomerase
MAARTDNVADPALAAELLLARRGQSFFARKVNELSDAQLREPSATAGWTRAHVIARVSLDAREIARAIEELRAGSDEPRIAAVDEHAVGFTATLPAEALRNLAAHTAVHLNVEWRDLPEDGWTRSVGLSSGGRITAADTVRRRAQELWSRAIDLDNGARIYDVPPEIRSDLLPHLLRRTRSS